MLFINANGCYASTNLSRDILIAPAYLGVCGGGGETGGSETPASRTFHSRFPPPSVGVPASLFYFYRKMLQNIAKFFSFSPGSRHCGNLASRPFSSRLP